MEQFFETRVKQLNNWAIIEYLFKWKNLPIEDAALEGEFFIQKNPQQINHRGKGLFKG